MDMLVTIENTWGDYEHSILDVFIVAGGLFTITLISILLSKSYWNTKPLVSTILMPIGLISLILIPGFNFITYGNYERENASIVRSAYEDDLMVSDSLNAYLSDNNIDPIVFNDKHCSSDDMSDNFVLCGGFIGAVSIENNDGIPIKTTGQVIRNSDDNIDLLVDMSVKSDSVF